MAINKLQYRPYYKRNLPHYQPKEGIFFITYRLAFSLPKVILNELENRKNEINDKLKRLTEKDKRIQETKYNKILFDIEDSFLDKYAEGPQWLKNPEIANLIIESLLFNHQKLYDLFCSLVMANHVHTILKPRNKEDDTPYSLAEIMRNHKGFTAHQANRILNRKGQFWHHENYDHCIRDERALSRVFAYVLNNPVKANLVESYNEWPHYWLNDEIISM